MGNRPINYAPQVSQNLSYLQRTSTEMADAAQMEMVKHPTSEELQPLLAAIVRGSVSEVQQSLGGFYQVDGAKYEPVIQGGVGTGPREFDPVEKAQLEVLIQKVLLSRRYEEGVNNFYEREVAQVASPVIVDGNVVAVAWVRRQLPSELKGGIFEERKFDNTATQKRTN
jgi:hypothetical protein